jgi:hypothetical protein
MIVFAQGPSLKKKIKLCFWSHNKEIIPFPLNFPKDEIVSQANTDLITVPFFQNKMFRHLVS